MRKTLLWLTLLASSFAIAQIPTDYVARYDFTTSTLVNIADPGNGDLNPSNTGYIFVDDRGGTLLNALSPKQRTFTGITLNPTTANPINSITFSFWYQHEFDVVGSNNERIMQFYDTNGTGLDIEKAPGDAFRFRVGTSDNVRQILYSNSSLFDGNWHHIVFTVNKVGNTFDGSVYINGVLESATSNSLDFTSSLDLLDGTTDYTISAVPNTFGLRSAIDDIRVYDRAISATEVTSLFNEVPTSNLLARVYVDPSANGDNTGSSWANAVNTIASGISIAQDNGEVWVKSGTYKPSTLTNRADFILIDRNISLYGGFNGTETNLSSRDLLNNPPSIISGDLLDNDDNQVIDGNTTYNDNSTTLVQINSANALIDGFTLTSSYASSASSPGDVAGFGGAIYVNNSIPEDITISNCIIERNVARGAGAGIYYQPINTGAGQPPISLTVQNSIIRNNLARYGTGIYYFSDNDDASLTITNTLFYDNASSQMASGDGAFGSSIWAGSLSEDGGLDIDIVNSSFIDNQELDDGFGSSIPQDRRSTIAITNTGGSSIDVYLVLYNSLFFNNTNLFTNTPCPVGRALGDRGARFLIDSNLEANNFSEITSSPPVSFVGNTVTTNPSFTDYANDDFTLVLSSSGIDQGDTSILSNYNISTDLIGNNRIINNTVDIGVYEFDGTLSTNDFDTTIEASVYPNPVSDKLVVQSKSQIKTLTIFNLLGKQIATTDNSEIEVSKIQSGVYVLLIQTETGDRITKKFIKR